MLNKNTKKGIGQIFYNTGAVVLIFFVLVLFVLASYFTKEVEQSILAKDKIEVNTILLNYLRTPVTIDNNEILVSDLIRLYVKDNEKYKVPLEDITKKTLSMIFKQYKLSINNKKFFNGDVAMSEDFESGAILQEMSPASSNEAKVTTSEVNLPGFTNNIKVKLVVE